MNINKLHKGKSGIYCITNLVNNKKYIGKSINIYNRISGHISSLNRQSRDSNRHLLHAWYKYGRLQFEYCILEEIPVTVHDYVNTMKDREIYWMKFYNTVSRELGYNLRQDSSSQTIMSDESKKLISLAVTGIKNPNYGNRWTDEQKNSLSTKLKLTFENGTRKPKSIEDSKKGSLTRIKRFQENPELLKQSSKKVSERVTKYYIEQYSKDKLVLINRWETVLDLLEKNPTYKRHNIYAVCSGEKPSIYGFWWKKVLKDDKVQS